MNIDSSFGSLAFLQNAGGGLVGLLPFVLIFVIFYFLLIRPPAEEATAWLNRNEKALLKALKAGDKGDHHRRHLRHYRRGARKG